MIYVLADNIISPLGRTSEENYHAVKAGSSAIRSYAPMTDGVPNGFMASLLSSDFEEIVFSSASKAISLSGINVSDKRIIFILSSTKGAIENLGKTEDEKLYLGETAQRIATRLGFRTRPIVVCNACISGSSALILASRLLQLGTYEYAVVCGADCPRQFIISGFQSLNAMSFEACRPFDIERQGLNLGEAAATVVLSSKIHSLSEEKRSKRIWQIGHGFIKNDAFHISAPSKMAEGLSEALQQTMEGIDKEELAFINAHGTATMFNDQMESIALQRTELIDIPINALKGYIGHTLGAAGIFETILCMKSIDDNTILGTRGYEESGVSGNVMITSENRRTEKPAFIKMLSGFGGCNATLFAKSVELSFKESEEKTIINRPSNTKKSHHVRITPNGAWLDGKLLSLIGERGEKSLLTSIYKQLINDYPKYYKMDGLCRLGFVASELLLQAEKAESEVDNSVTKERAIILFNHTSSISSDKRYLASIADKDNFFPSPSVFVYTLPNIVTGEIAIRNGYHGETSFYILPQRDEKQMNEVIETAFVDRKTKSVLTGWLDYEDNENFEADMYILCAE
ncbi:beta-ketoacyl synthase N-terminal-like domain-containing protein [Prevotella aurantiaca]|jgi:3-oxoacyl-[acyl-carrier-protein] synthase II|uniref:3-oxoacyl-ACP synthase n=1 Tax=Prevotella aurantiaca TaxID=596085 RepID=A0A930HMB5_9BACT|nr:beta-ketoacyl synthase N-terminal-like domain-containing protein [Prevotella aurantiaca]MBF1384346.1 3-oxoacyl-ACP synthase [Prevotella aurantiaca]MBF1385799.1 3-oxoacyl-ACP synthase [Prevotella aurantiaca]